MNDLEPVAESTMSLMDDIEMLMMDDEVAPDDALIADYFFVNESVINFVGDTDNDLVSPFCVTGMSVLKFKILATIRDTRSGPGFGTRGATLVLLINEVQVASAAVFDGENPNNVKLTYRGFVDVDSEVRLVARVGKNDDVIIAPKELQWGYKLYGPDYALLENLNTTCVSS